MITPVLVCAVSAAALWYLFAHSDILRPIQIRYPPWLDLFTSCAACSGFWYGGALATIGRIAFGWSYLGLPVWAGTIAAALISIWTTPLLGWAQLAALRGIQKISSENHGQ